MYNNIMKLLLTAFVLHTKKFIPAKLYLSIRYRLEFGKLINWDNPKGFNEKLNWMKLNYRNPLFTMTNIGRSLTWND